MVVGQGRMAAFPAKAGLLLVFHHPLRAKELSLISQVLVALLRRVRQDRRQDDLQIVDDTQDLEGSPGSGTRPSKRL